MPIPKANKGESKDNFLDRCMSDPVMRSEYPDSKQRSAICIKNFAKGDNMNELDVEIFAVGEWNGMNFTIEDLNGMANAFGFLADVHKVPLKFGHNDDQPFTDGQPALGWVSKIWVDDAKLMAKFVDIPNVVYKAIEKRLYKHVSVELDMGVEHSGRFFSWVLSGVALLGADIPAVNTLADLTAFMTKELDHTKRVVFNKTAKPTTPSNSGGSDMDMVELEAKLKAEQAKNEALVAQNTTLVTDNVKFSADNATLEADKKAKDEADKRVEMTRVKTEFTTSLESLVKDETITPAQREKFSADLKDDLSNIDALNYALETIKMSKGKGGDMSGGEQGRQDQGNDNSETSMNADEIVVNRTHKYMRKHGEKDFSFAKKQVLQADNALAKDYANLAQV